MKTTLGVLRDARELVDHGWAQGSSATTIDQQPVSWSSPAARCFCIGGAVARASDEPDDVAGWMKHYGPAIASLTHVLKNRGSHSSVQRFNDAPERTIHEVLELFDATIAMEETFDKTIEEIKKS